MALAGELAKYIGNELVNTGSKALAKAGATSALSSLVPSAVTKVGADLANKSVLSSLVPATARKLASGLELGSEAIPLFRGQMNRLDKLDYNNPNGVSPTSNGFFMTPNKGATDSWAGKGIISVDADPNDIMTLSELEGLKKDAERYFSDPKYQMQLYNTNPRQAEIYDALEASDNYQSLSQLTNKPFIERDGGQGKELGELVFFPDTRPELTAKYNDILASGKNQWATSAVDNAPSPLTDIYNNAHNIPEVQLDDDIAKQLDKAMGYLKEKKNIPVETTGEYPNDFSRIPVRFTNKEIDTLHKYTGKIPELYHQTSASSLGDMTLDRRRGVSGDSGMPEGIFLKDNDKDIGLMGKNQLALNAKMENPAYFKDRADLDNFMRSRGAKDLMSRRKELDDYYQKLSDEAEKKQHDLAMIAWDDPTPENKALAKQAMDEWQKITEEWTKAVDNNGEVAREGIRNTLVNNGYDSAIIENDEGSGGRSVKSYIVFDKNQLSPRYKEGISFDPNDVKSIYAETTKRQKNLDELMDKVADLVEASGDKATYKSGGNKSIESMTNKVARKMAGGRDYRLMDMKDHMRGAVMLENLNNEADEITNLLQILQYELDQPVGIEVVDTDLGYSGLHLTWRDEDGLGYEIQVTTPEVWDTKLASDKLYDEVRNWTSSELNADPAKRARYNEVKEASKALWDKTWKKLGGRPNLKPLESFNDDIYFY